MIVYIATGILMADTSRSAVLKHSTSEFDVVHRCFDVVITIHNEILPIKATMQMMVRIVASIIRSTSGIFEVAFAVALKNSISAMFRRKIVSTLYHSNIKFKYQKSIII